ncbi:MAG: DUF4221 domain-containing protein, partial [Cyclobacteriaceae bacterium]|nr:DUF4221 domain-containing protein [Cyclobacteriaceae bacterium]
FIYIQIMIFCLACEHKAEEQGRAVEVKLRKSETIKIPISETVVPYSRAVFYHSSLYNRPTLSYMNQDRNEILLFDLDSLKLYRTLSLENEGNNGVGFVFGYYFVSEDSLYITSRSGRRLFLVNDSLKVMQKIEYRETTSGELTGADFYSRNNINTPLIIHHNDLYLTNFLGGYYGNYSPMDVDNYKAGLKIKKDGSDIRFTSMTYPSGLWEKERKSPEYSKIQAGEKMVYLWQYHPYLYSETFDGRIDSTEILSDFYHTKIKKPKDLDAPTMLRYKLEAPSFFNLAYDPFREYYYVFVQKSYTPESQDFNHLQKLYRNTPSFSIIILDKEMKKIGEQSLPEFTYLANNFFITEKGLYLSENNEFNPSFDENYLTFTLFEF